MTPVRVDMRDRIFDEEEWVDLLLSKEMKERRLREHKRHEREAALKDRVPEEKVQREETNPNTSPPMDSPPMDSPPKDSPLMDSPLMDSPPNDSLPKDSLPKDSLPKDSLPKDSLPKDSPSKDSLSKDVNPSSYDLKGFRNFDWDDSELVRAYNKGMKNKTKKESKGPKDKVSLLKKWQVGSNCSAKFSGDGLYYEAKIISLNGDFCTVEFWGYNDTENIALKDLEESEGKRARKRQIKESAAATIANMHHSSEEDLESEGESTVASGYNHAVKDGGKSRHENHTIKKNDIQMPHEAYHYPGPAAVPTSGPYTQQFQPPSYVPPPPPHTQVLPPFPDELAGLAPMLMAWYWAGYYSGLYSAREPKNCAQGPGPRTHNCPHAHQCCCHY